MSHRFRSVSAAAAAVLLATVLAGRVAAEPIRVAFGDIPSVENLNLLIALERAKERGVEVETSFLKSEDIAAQAVVGGQADVGVGTPCAPTRKARAPIRLFLQLARLRFYPVVNTEFYNDWKDLDGQQIVAGLLRPTAGEVRIGGRRVDGPGPERAFVFEDFALVPWATVLRNVAFGLELRGVSRAEREEVARRYIREVGLEGFEQRYPHELSGGMRQRVGLARALAVDEQTRRKFQEDLLALREVERKTFLFVTHSIEEAVYLSDRIVLLSPRPGRVSDIVEPGMPRDLSPDRIRRHPVYLDTVEAIRQGLRRYVE